MHHVMRHNNIISFKNQRKVGVLNRGLWCHVHCLKYATYIKALCGPVFVTFLFNWFFLNYTMWYQKYLERML